MVPYPDIVTLLVAAPIAIATMVYDVRTMEIPNWLTGGAAIIFIALIFLTLPLDDALWRLAGGAVALVACMALFFAGGMGGGDGKALAGFALLVAPIDRPFVLLLLAVLALICLAGFWLFSNSRIAGAPWQSAEGDELAPIHKRKVPYGVVLGLTILIYLSLVVFIVP